VKCEETHDFCWYESLSFTTVEAKCCKKRTIEKNEYNGDDMILRGQLRKAGTWIL
jgi:hypothetical protein